MLTAAQRGELRTRALRSILHSSIKISDIFDGIPDDDLREGADLVINTMKSRLAFLQRAKPYLRKD
jgi:hypothetical protein